MSAYTYLILALQVLFISYCVSTTCFLITSIFSGRLQKVRSAYLSTANTIAAAGALILVIMLIVDLVRVWQIDMDKTFFRYRLSTNIKIIFFYLAAGLLTIITKLRRSVPFTLVLIALYAILTFMEAIYIFILSFNRDYLPSSWAYYRSDADYLLPIIFSIVYFFICYLVATRRKR